MHAQGGACIVWAADRPALHSVITAARNNACHRAPQLDKDTSTRLSENEGAWPMSAKADDEMLFTVPSLS